MLVMIDGPMINRFIDDVETFRVCAEQRFQTLDTNGDGLLSRADIQNSIPGSISSDDNGEPAEEEHVTVDMIFDRFDADANGGIDKRKFRLMLMEILVALARGIGAGVPVNVGVEEGSLLLHVHNHEAARIEREKSKKEEEEAAAAVKERNQSIYEGRRSPDNNTVKLDGRKLRKKRSKKLFGICACSGKYNVTLD